MVTVMLLYEMYKLKEYLENDKSPYDDWFSALDARAAARVNTFVKRMESGNFGISEPVGKGVTELKIDVGPGYRVYYGRDGKTLIILLGGGSKRKQSSDIKKAIERWEMYKQLKKQSQEKALKAKLKKRRKGT
jgi:putative addiction module killer protein